MFCPGCGIEEREGNQFCRACGTDLRPVRYAVESPDRITASAVSARDEIGRAIAYKIREAQSAEDLAVVVEEVLPEIEKFLESPEEKRLRGVRNGTMVAAIGVGGAIAFTIVAQMMGDRGILILAGAGVVTLFVGLSLILNALFFSIPRKSLPDKAPEGARQRRLDAETNELVLPAAKQEFTSVTEETTRHLREKEPAPRS